MADKGIVPQDLIKKRISAEIKRLEYQIEQQELEKMELDQRKQVLDDNIAASKGEIEKQHGNLAALNKVEVSPDG